MDESVEKNGNEKTEPVRAASNKSLQLLMKASGVCINSASFAGVVQGKHQLYLNCLAVSVINCSS